MELNPTLKPQEITEYALQNIRQAKIQTNPFPHILIEELFPKYFFNSIAEQFPDRTEFQKAIYPGIGTSISKKREHFKDYGLVCNNLTKSPLWKLINDFFNSEGFTEELLAKFKEPLPSGIVPIPKEKHIYFQDGAKKYKSVFALHIDLPGYEIPPHPDIPEKIITYQLFVVNGESLSDFGTIFCKFKGGILGKLSLRIFRKTGKNLSKLANSLGINNFNVYQDFKKSKIGFWLGINHKNWFPWGFFNVAKTIPALPNYFMAFAPNQNTYHAVSLDIPIENKEQERRVIRGFIRSGSNSKNWIKYL
jgi:hypothetical protein